MKFKILLRFSTPTLRRWQDLWTRTTKFIATIAITLSISVRLVLLQNPASLKHHLFLSIRQLSTLKILYDCLTVELFLLRDNPGLEGQFIQGQDITVILDSVKKLVKTFMLLARYEMVRVQQVRSPMTLFTMSTPFRH